jgi:hypothetical protein
LNYFIFTKKSKWASKKKKNSKDKNFPNLITLFENIEANGLLSDLPVKLFFRLKSQERKL